jgi:hypothetical protein
MICWVAQRFGEENPSNAQIAKGYTSPGIWQQAIQPCCFIANVLPSDDLAGSFVSGI